MKQCPNCMTVLPDTARFCTACGTRLPKQPPGWQPEPPAAQTEESPVAPPEDLFVELPEEPFSGQMESPGWQPEQPPIEQLPPQPRKPRWAMVAAVALLGVIAAGAGGLLAWRSIRQNNAQQLRAEAAALLQQGEYAQAAQAAQDALAKQPDDAEWLRMLAVAQAAQGDYQAAAAAYAQLDIAALPTGELPAYIRTMLHTGQLQPAADALARCLAAGEACDAALLEQAATAAAAAGDAALLQSCLAGLDTLQANGSLQPDARLQCAQAVLQAACAAPSQPVLQPALQAYLTAASQAGQTPADFEQQLVASYTAWRATAAQPLQGDLACYSLIDSALAGHTLQPAAQAAYSAYLTQPVADVQALAQALLAQSAAGTFEANAANSAFCERILLACAQQNGSEQRLAQLEAAMQQGEHRQAVALWEAEPWLQAGELWYQGGALSLLAPDTTQAPALRASAAYIYYGQAAGNLPDGSGAAARRDTNGHVLYYNGAWANGVMGGEWTDMDAAPAVSRPAATQSSGGGASGSGGTAQQAQPPTREELEQMMREAEQRAQALLNSIQ